MTVPAAVDHTIGDIHVEIHGGGRPVLLIHGNSGDLHYFDRNVPTFAAHRRVVAMDCRGQGRSARGTGPLTIARMAEDAADVIRALADHEETGFDVVGFSDGANVAMTLAVRHPELVRSLVLNSGNIAVNGMRWSLRWKLRLADGFLRVKYRELGLLTHEHELIRLMLDQPGITAADLGRITVPTLVLAGSRDLIRPAHTRMIARLIRGAQRRVIRGGTPFVMRDKPEIATMMVEAFLETGRAPMAYIPA